MQLIRKRLASTPDSKAGIKTGVRKTWCILVMVLAMVIQSPRGLALDEGNSKNAVLGREDLRKGHADNRKPATVPTAKPKTEYHFLDKQQELLAKSGKWEDFARFAGKGDLSRLEIHVDTSRSRASPTTFGEGANSVTEFVHGNSQVLYGFDWLGGNR
jgi:hypothetical protein